MRIIWAFAVLLAAAAFGGSTYLVPDFGGFDPDLFPIPQNDPPVQPAGFAFSIWIVIYLWLLIGAGYGVLRRRDALDWAEMRPPLVLSLTIGAVWLPVALVTPIGATVLIWAMLISALFALFHAPILDRWWARAPIGLYAGWLSAASLVAIGLLLGGYGLMEMRSAALLCLTLALLLGAGVQLALEGTPEYGVAIVWAFLAIALHNIGGPVLVMLLALACAAIMGLLALRAWTLPRF